MNSRHCEKCVADWPKHHLNCPVCQGPCPESSKHPMDEEMYRWLLYTKKGRLVSVPKAVQEKVDAEWDALEVELARRGDRWTVVDLLEEGFCPKVVADS